MIMKNIYLKLLIFLFFCLTNEVALASGVKIKNWGSKIVHDGQMIGVTWVPAAIVVCGVLSILGIQFAQGMLAKILMGAGLIFGAGAIGSTLKGLFT